MYEVPNRINDDVTLYCQLATCDLIVFEEAVKDKMEIIMDEEIASIKKNDT